MDVRSGRISGPESVDPVLSDKMNRAMIPGFGGGPAGCMPEQNFSFSDKKSRRECIHAGSRASNPKPTE